MNIKDHLSEGNSEATWDYVQKNIGKVSAFKIGNLLSFNSVHEHSLLKLFGINNDEVEPERVSILLDGYLDKQIIRDSDFLELMRWPYSDMYEYKAVSILIDCKYLAEAINMLQDSEAVSFILFNLDKIR